MFVVENIIGLIIVLAMCLVITILYLKEKKSWAIVLTMVGLCIMPVIKVLPVDINGSYLFTVMLFMLLIRDLVTRRYSLKSINKNIKIYSLLMAAILVVYVIAWFINGNPNFSGLIALAGNINYIASVAILAILIDSIDTVTDRYRIKKVFFVFILITVAINLVFTFLQAYVYDAGLWVTDTLYGSEHRYGPINQIINYGRFSRLYGTFFTPIILGGFSLLAAILMFTLFTQEKLNKYYLILGSAATFIGVLSLTKTLLLGVPVILVGLIILGFFLDKELRKEYLKRTMAVILCVAISYGAGYLFTPNDNKGHAKYYFGMILNPVDALSSRYAGIFNKDETVVPAPDDEDYLEEPLEQDDDEPKGIVDSAFGVFKKHAVIGVGLSPINGEFMGDSYFISILHNGGLVAFSLFVILFCYLFFTSLKKKYFDKVVLLVGLAACCLSMPVLSYPFSIPFFAYILKKDEE